MPELPASYAEIHRYNGAAIEQGHRDALVPCAVQPRDVAIVHDVSRYKFITAPQLSKNLTERDRIPPPAQSHSTLLER